MQWWRARELDPFVGFDTDDGRAPGAPPRLTLGCALHPEATPLRRFLPAQPNARRPGSRGARRVSEDTERSGAPQRPLRPASGRGTAATAR